MLGYGVVGRHMAEDYKQLPPTVITYTATPLINEMTCLLRLLAEKNKVGL